MPEPWASGWLACSSAHHKERLISGINLWLANQAVAPIFYDFYWPACGPAHHGVLQVSWNSSNPEMWLAWVFIPGNVAWGMSCLLSGRFPGILSWTPSVGTDLCIFPPQQLLEIQGGGLLLVW